MYDYDEYYYEFEPFVTHFGFSAVLLFFLIAVIIFVITEVVCVVICNMIAKNKGLPKSYKWFGLLGILGIIVVAVISPPMPPMPYYPPVMPNQPQPDSTRQPVSPPVSQPQPDPSQQTGQNDAPEQTLKYCTACGSKAGEAAVFCTHYGKKL